MMRVCIISGILLLAVADAFPIANHGFSQMFDEMEKEMQKMMKSASGLMGLPHWGHGMHHGMDWPSEWPRAPQGFSDMGKAMDKLMSQAPYLSGNYHKEEKQTEKAKGGGRIETVNEISKDEENGDFFKVQKTFNKKLPNGFIHQEVYHGVGGSHGSFKQGAKAIPKLAVHSFAVATKQKPPEKILPKGAESKIKDSVEKISEDGKPELAEYLKFSPDRI